ncbi:unnamed protein product [Psylliodes chrysocephalus]|uniref:PX domain-containing protein n=1 Tax=Psylliodes chrysocephalus TaxID=3402493 RepID=A0A9P0CR64_9CUCU|nr:unnamed protein product [Psylliodes chrysocephala]
MACFWLNAKETTINIFTTEEINNVTYYNIKVSVGDCNWKVAHRYNEFYELHNQLVIDHGVSKDILPSKKVIRNKCPIFIESRRKGLEEYLQKTLVFLKRTMPKSFVEFLEFNLYDIFFLLQDLSAKLFLESDQILSSKSTYFFTVLELHALSEFLKKPLLDQTETRFDISPVVDLCSQLSSITVSGDSKPYLGSNIILNKLQFDLSPFKCLKVLYLKQVAFESLNSLGSIRCTVQKLHVNHTNATTISQVLQCDVIHKDNIEGSQKWVSLEILDLNSNNITEIDSTIKLALKVTQLSLNDNKISTITNLSHLPNLSQLNLANNLISICTDLHTRVGNLKTLNLSQNNINCCKAFSRLYSLETLDLSCNKINNVEDIQFLGDLPCLENLVLTGNNVATAVDYRVKVLEYFGDRAKNLCLDNEKPSQAELDKVSVLRALRIVKEGKTPDLKAGFAIY